MKHTWKVLSLLIVLLTVLCLVVSCGDDTTDNSGNNGNNNGGGETIIGSIDASGMKFASSNGLDYSTTKKTFSVVWTGSAYRLTSSNLKSIPERATVEFHYYSDAAHTNLLATFDADGILLTGDNKYANGFSDAGTYYVRVLCTRKQYSDGFKDVEMIIEASYGVNYTLGLPTNTNGATFSATGNISNFTSGTRDAKLYTPTLTGGSVGYKFRGWYLDSACTDQISVINGNDARFSALLSSGTLTLYAKFDACVEFPVAFQYTSEITRVETAPTTLPAIPGFNMLPEDKVTLIDMSLLYGEEGSQGYGYQCPEQPEGLYGLSKDPVVTTENGEYAVPWTDINDTRDDGERDPLTGEPIGGYENHYANDNKYGGALCFTKLTSGFNYANYNTLEFWIYNANKSENIISLVAFVNSTNKQNMNIAIELNFSGWKKFSFHVNDFKTSTSSHTANITQINIYGSSLFNGGIPTNGANLCDDKQANFVYFSSFYLTNCENSIYNPSVSINSNEMSSIFENITSVNVNAEMDDDAVAAALELLADNSTGDTGALFQDIPLVDSYGVAATYQRLFLLSEAWNDKSNTTYYHNADLLTAIADGLNYMSIGAGQLVNANVASDEYYEIAAYYIVKTALNISDYVNEVHAATWMVPVLYFTPTPYGEGQARVRNAYTYAGAQMLLGNTREFLTGMRMITEIFNDNRITLALNTADITDVMQLIRALDGTLFEANSQNQFVTDLFRWFYDNVDIFLVDGVVPYEIAAYNSDVTLATYIRAMLMVYDIAPEAVQNKFAAAVKYYFAQNPGLEDEVKYDAYYSIETEALNALLANSATAANPNTATTTIATWENIGQVYYRTENGSILFDKEGNVVSDGIYVDAVYADRFYCMQVGEILAVATPDLAIFITPDGATESYYSSGFATFTYNNTSMMVSYDALSVENDSASENGDIYKINNAPAMVAVTVNSDNSLNVEVYNYTGMRAEIQVQIKGQYLLSGTSDVCETSLDSSSNITTLSIKLNKEPQTEFPSIRPTTDDSFSVKLNAR